MPIRTALFGILGFALAQPLAADSLHVDCNEHHDVQTQRPYPSQICALEKQQPRYAPDIISMAPGPHLLGDVFGGRGLDQHVRALRAIAIYNSVGNRRSVEILSRRLHRFGVTPAEIQDALNRTKLHAGRPNASLLQQFCKPAFREFGH
jgi:alkylhydroperoxidase/carboxymuconolactone decarboxylase family protein YurZ